MPTLRKFETYFDIGDDYEGEKRYIGVEMPEQFRVYVNEHNFMEEIINTGEENDADFLAPMMCRHLVPLLRKYGLKFNLDLYIEVLESFASDLEEGKLKDYYDDLELPELGESIEAMTRAFNHLIDWKVERIAEENRKRQMPPSSMPVPQDF